VVLGGGARGRIRFEERSCRSQRIVPFAAGGLVKAGDRMAARDQRRRRESGRVPWSGKMGDYWGSLTDMFSGKVCNRSCGGGSSWRRSWGGKGRGPERAGGQSQELKVDLSSLKKLMAWNGNKSRVRIDRLRTGRGGGE